MRKFVFTLRKDWNGGLFLPCHFEPQQIMIDRDKHTQNIQNIIRVLRGQDFRL